MTRYERMGKRFPMRRKLRMTCCSFTDFHDFLTGLILAGNGLTEVRFNKSNLVIKSLLTALAPELAPSLYTSELLMPEQSQRIAVVCPKCHCSNTARTGAYTFESAAPKETESTRVSRESTWIVYDRKCLACGRHFTEMVEHSSQ